MSLHRPPGRSEKGILMVVPAVLLTVCVMAAAAGCCFADGLPRVAILVDDLGFSLDAARQLAALPFPITWAIIPYERHSLATAELAVREGIPFLLHLPMEAIGDREKGRHSLIETRLTTEAIRLRVRNALWSLPGACGMNNHRGSRATQDVRVMEAVLAEAAAEGVFFIDSRTSGNSLAYETAMQMGVQSARNASFIDHENSVAFMKRQIAKVVQMARQKGRVLAICHARTGTIRFLSGLYETIDTDVQFVTVPEYLKSGFSGAGEE